MPPIFRKEHKRNEIRKKVKEDTKMYLNRTVPAKTEPYKNSKPGIVTSEPKPKVETEVVEQKSEMIPNQTQVPVKIPIPALKIKKDPNELRRERLVQCSINLKRDSCFAAKKVGDEANNEVQVVRQCIKCKVLFSSGTEHMC
jgi:hypothetical protein